MSSKSGITTMEGAVEAIIQSHDLEELDALIAEFYSLASYKRKAVEPAKPAYPLEAIAPKNFYSRSNHESDMPYSLDYYKDLI